MTVLYAEYVWLDGGQGKADDTPSYRSRTRMLSVPDEAKNEDGSFSITPSNLPVWSFDGSSTGQAETGSSDCVLIPCFAVPNPFVKDSLIILCEVFTDELKPHETNHRARLTEFTTNNVEALEMAKPALGFEQEYVLETDGIPLGWPERGQPEPQGPYYCGNGHGRVRGRSVTQAHTTACLRAGLSFGGTNAEVMLGQWEYQIGGPGVNIISACDHLVLSRFLLERVSEDKEVSVNWDPKPVSGDWNGSGLHANFSTEKMRAEGGMEEIKAFLEKLSTPDAMSRHLESYGEGIERRLTGSHETSKFDEFTWGVSDRGASVRLPWNVNRAGFGYLEDRRPNSNANPYRVCLSMLQTLLEGEEIAEEVEAAKEKPARKKTTTKKSSAKKAGTTKSKG